MAHGTTLDTPPYRFCTFAAVVVLLFCFLAGILVTQAKHTGRTQFLRTELGKFFRRGSQNETATDASGFVGDVLPLTVFVHEHLLATPVREFHPR